MKAFLLLSTAAFLTCQTVRAQIVQTPPASWCLQEVTDQDGNKVLITANLGYKNYADKAKFPWCLAVNITTLQKYPNGLPTAEEAPILNTTEDMITEALVKAGATQFIGRVTMKGYRELYYFVTNPDKADAALKKLAKKRQPREWEYQMQEDENWSRVAPFFRTNAKCL